MTTPVGSAFVRVRLITDQLSSDIRRSVEQAGLAGHIRDEIQRGIREAGGAGAGGGGLGRGVGQQAGDAFTREFRTRVDAAIRSLPPRVTIDANTDPAVAELENLRRQIRETDAHLRIGRIDDETAIRQIDEIQTRLAALARESPNIRVRVDAAAAAAQLAALRHEEEALERKTHDLGFSFNLLLDGALLLAPALLPIGAVAVAALGPAALAAGSLLLGIRGVKQEMTAGTQTGQVFAGAIGLLKGNLKTLQGVAASGLLGPFNAAVLQLQTQMPNLTRQVALFSGVTGDIAGRTLSAFITSLHTLSPLFQTILAYFDRGAVSLQAWASGSGLQNFSTYAQSQLPRVVNAFEALFTALGRISRAAGPLGGVVLNSITALANVINSLPMPVLATLVTTFVAVRTAGLALRVLTSVFDAVSAAMARTGAAAGVGAAGSLGILGGVAAVVGIGMFALTSIMNNNAKQAQQLAKDTQSYTQALTDNAGAQQDATNQTLLKNLADDKSYQSLVKAGLTTTTLIGLFNKQNLSVNDTIAALEAQGLSFGENAIDAQLLTGKLKEQQKALATSKTTVDTNTQALQQYDAALAQMNPQLAAQAAAVGLTITAYQTGTDAIAKKTAADQKNLDVLKITYPEYQTAAKALGLTAAGYLNAKDAATQSADSTKKQAEQMAVAGDKAGLLKLALDQLNGKALDTAQATNQFDAGLLNLTGTVLTAKQGGDKYAASLDNMTSAGNRNVANIISLIQQNNSLSQAVANQSGSLTKGTAAYEANIAQIKRAAAAAGLNKQQVDALIASIGRVPSVKNSTVVIGTLTAEQRIANVRAALARIPSLKNTQVTLSNVAAVEKKLAQLSQDRHVLIRTQLIGPTGATAGGRLAVYAGGGYVQGPGTSTSDSIVARLSNKEFVVNADATAKFRPLLEQINSGTSGGGAQGGSVAVAASPGGDAVTARLDALINRVDALAASVGDRPVQLVLERGGQPLARAVNDANQRLNRRN